MKQLLAGILTAIALVSLPVPAFAAEGETEEAAPSYTIIVGEQTLDPGGLPQAPYLEGNTIMVPLRKISQALGYQVSWDSETGAVTVEDSYIQMATLFHGTEKVVFEGKLQIIDMSREIETPAKTVIHDGCTYVPLEFFKEFLNVTLVDGTTITVAPSMCQINARNIDG